MRERYELRLLGDVSIFVSDFLSLHFNESGLVNRSAGDIELYGIGFIEVKEIAGTIARHRV